MRDIRRPDSTEGMVERLTTAEAGGVATPVFPTIMDLLIFCAGIGLAMKRTGPVSAGGKVVPYRVFQNNQKEGFIYLLALAAKQDPGLLSGERDEEVVSLFEEYAAGGLAEVASWLAEDPSDISGIRVLISKLQSRLSAYATPPSAPSAV